MSGEGGRALGEEDAELAGGALEEADQHGCPPWPKQLAGGGGCRYGGITGVRGGRRLVEPQPSDERLDVRAGRLPLHDGGSWEGEIGGVGNGGRLRFGCPTALTPPRLHFRFIYII